MRDGLLPGREGASAWTGVYRESDSQGAAEESAVVVGENIKNVARI